MRTSTVTFCADRFAGTPDLELVRVQDVGLNQTPDSDILEWAANQERVLISQNT